MRNKPVTRRVLGPTHAARTTGRRSWRLVQLMGAALLVAAVVSVTLSTRASALGSGSTVTTAIQTVGTVTANTPFSSGQQVDVVIPANTVLNPNLNINIVECEAPGGVVPTDPSDCDGSTIQGASIRPNSDGSVDLHAESHSYYTLYALPDLVSLGETSGNTCNLTNECVLYIGENQGDFTQPHFWSNPFYIAPNGTDDGSNPGDGSPPPAPTLPSATLSTVTASGTTAAADGEDPVTVTVTLLGTGGVPVPGKTVSLSQGAGNSTITPGATPNTSDASGDATFTVTDGTAESVTFSATDSTDGIDLTQQVTVDFQVPTIDPAHSSVVATPSAVPADGVTAATITVTLRDQAAEAQPLAGRTVTLSGTGHSTIGPASPAQTNAQGQVTFSVTDTTVELVTYSAVDTTDKAALTSTAQVTFGTLSVSPSASTVAGESPAPVNGFGSQVTVTLLTSTSAPVSGKTVTLSSPSSTVTIAPQGSDVSGSNGQVIFNVHDSVAESATFAATDTTDDNLQLTQSATVLFQTSAPSGTASTMTETPATLPADGSSQAVIAVTMTDQFGNPLAGKTVQLSANPSGSVQFRPVAVGGTGTPGVTNAAGLADFEADDTTAETVTFTAKDTTDGVTLTDTVSATFTAGSADGNQSTVTSSPSNVPSDGKTASTVTVTLLDHFLNPVEGKTISLSALNGSSVITPVNDVTGANGEATFDVTDDVAEVVSYTATDTTDTLPLSATGLVTFGNPPVPPPALADSAIVSNQMTVPADGSSSATITVLLYDATGDVVPGKIISLAPSGGSSTITALTGATGLGGSKHAATAVTGTTGSNGEAQFSVTDTTAESVTYTATDTTDNMPLTGLSVTVSFSGAAGATTTTTTTTTTSPTTSTTATTVAGGTSTTTTSTPTSVTVVPASTSSGDSGSTGGTTGESSTSTGAALAFTGAPSLLPWLLGLGSLLLAIGTLGRRLLTRRSR